MGDAMPKKSSEGRSAAKSVLTVTGGSAVTLPTQAGISSRRKIGGSSIGETLILEAPIRFSLIIPAGAARQAFVVALGKDGHAYLLDRNDLGGIGGSLVNEVVSPRAIRIDPRCGYLAAISGIKKSHLFRETRRFRQWQRARQNFGARVRVSKSSLGAQHAISFTCFPLYPKRMIPPFRLRHR
jgi:hypothetical protein